jgi:Protein of unknown function (DUF1553)/Protein of unknown function (DUF1549)
MKNTQALVAFLCGVAASAVALGDDAPSANASTAAVQTAVSAPATAARSQLWSYQPIRSQQVPAVHQKKWVRSPIDAFVLAKLDEKALAPSPDASRAAFVRRATLDTLGVIPTPEAVQAFVADRSPDAYERLVDSLLASPHHGERLARHWLDLARYADSAGFQNDQTRANAWRYRDYVINAFNSDKPYDQFIKEQLAGDEIPSATKEDLIATGFLTQYPDNANARDLLQRKYQITTDMVDTVGQVFLAQSVGCARCHDHKFDKISQKEYFQLQAFFANTSEVNDIPAEKGSEEIAFEQAREKYQAATKEIRDQQKAIIDPIRDAAIKYHKERYLQDSQVSLFKPESDWTPLDRWVNHRLANVTQASDYFAYLNYVGENKDDPNYTKENGERFEKYKKLQEELKKYDSLRPLYGSDKITAVSELGRADSPPTHRLFGGIQDRPEEEVQPDFPAAIAQGVKPHIVPTATSSGRRTALAEWIASPSNPLTARVFANRVWSWYFGTGIVATVSDFGRAGQRPTNPELLDYLADSFVRNGWSVKKLEREILLSSVYRQSSDNREDAYKVDPENKLLAVYPRRRMDAEEIRDSLLVASGQLNDKIGGLSVFPPLPKGLGKGGVNGFTDLPLWTVSKDSGDWNRRSLYVFTRRSVAYPMLANFDMASPQQVHSKRDVTTTPLQALTLYNDELVFQWSQALAGRVIREAGHDAGKQIGHLYQILFAREPDRFEKSTLQAFLREHQKVIEQDGDKDGKLELAQPVGRLVATSYKSSDAPDPLRDAAFVDLVHSLVNSNEFAYKF